MCTMTPAAALYKKCSSHGEIFFAPLVVILSLSFQYKNLVGLSVDRAGIWSYMIWTLGRDTKQSRTIFTKARGNSKNIKEPGSCTPISPPHLTRTQSSDLETKNAHTHWYTSFCRLTRIKSSDSDMQSVTIWWRFPFDCDCAFRIHLMAHNRQFFSFLRLLHNQNEVLHRHDPFGRCQCLCPRSKYCPIGDQSQFVGWAYPKGWRERYVQGSPFRSSTKASWPSPCWRCRIRVSLDSIQGRIICIVVHHTTVAFWWLCRMFDDSQ